MQWRAVVRTRPNPSLERHFWSTGIERVAGVDEVGVGAWAGLVIAAAVIFLPEQLVEGLNDSELLSAKRRSELFALISESAGGIGVGRAEVEEVDRLNVYWAAMFRRGAKSLGIDKGSYIKVESLDTKTDG